MGTFIPSAKIVKSSNEKWTWVDRIDAFLMGAFIAFFFIASIGAAIGAWMYAISQIAKALKGVE